MIGKTVSHYKILEKLGEGGMGKVYLAEDTQLFRKVVLKFLPKDLTADKFARERFNREAKAIAAFNHPNIITIHESSEFMGRSYIVMEYMDGKTLKERITHFKETPCDLKRIKDIIIIAIQICKGLEKAHQANIIHRDIKPGNILINTDGQVKIMDFGIAKLIGDSTLTKETSTLGTTYYMSPEHIKGQEIDHRSDIWSFGVVLYEMITGEHPFKGEYLQALFYSILNEGYVPVSDLNPDIPEELEKIVNKCLIKEAIDRYSSISETLADLKRLKQYLDTEDDAVKIKKERVPVPIFKRVSRMAIPLAVLVFILLFILIPNPGREAVKKWIGTGKVPDKKHIAVLPSTIIADDLSCRILCDGIVKNTVNKLIQAEKFHKDFWIVPPRKMRMNKINSVRDARRTFEITMAVDMKFDVILKGVNKRINLGLKLINSRSNRQLKSVTINDISSNLSAFKEEVILKFTKMMDLKMKPDEQKTLFAGDTALPGAYELYLSGLGYMFAYESSFGVLVDLSKDSLDSAINNFEKAVKQDPSYVMAFSELGRACWEKYMMTKMKKWAEASELYSKKAIEINDLIPIAHYNAGIIYRGSGKYDAAIIEFKRAVSLNPEYFDAQIELAKTFEKAKKFKEAEDAYRKAIEMRNDYQGGYHHLGYFLLQIGRSSEAAENFKKAADLTPENYKFYYGLIPIYFYLDRIDLAEEMFKKSIAIKPTGDAYTNIASVLFFKKKYSEALEKYEVAVELQSEKYLNWGNLGDCYRVVPGYSTQAVEAYEKAIQLIKKELDKNPRDESKPEKLSHLAVYYSKTGNHEKSIAEISRALSMSPDDLKIIRDSILVYEFANRREKALMALREFIERQGPMGEIENDPDLKNLLSDVRYRQLIKNKNPSKENE